MSNFGYRSIWYDSWKKRVHLWTWNDQGDRVECIEQFSPFLYIETSTAVDGTSIYNTPLRKITFPSQFERRKYVKEGGVKRLFFNHKPEQQFLLGKYLGLNESLEFSSQPLKIFSIDIEVYSPHEFPTAAQAKHPINLITIHDSLTNTYHAFGLEPYSPTRPDVQYYHCSSEEALLEKFLSFWKKDYPDVVTGWNSDGFDTPYIINRITNLLGEDRAKELSPVNSIFYKNDIVQKFGQSVGRWVIHGVNCVDYKEIYELFAREKREAYNLDYIAKVELNAGKIKINATNLAKLSKSSWKDYVEYNIQDVNLLVRLEEKLRFLKIMRTIAYKGFCNISDTLGKVTVVTGAISAQALKRNKILSTFEHEEMGNYAGGYVKDIEPGLREGVVTFDANSLYPNTIITLNLSPETKLGKITKQSDVDVEIQLNNNSTYTLTRSDFQALCTREKIAVSKADTLFSQKQKGIVPEYVDSLYAERVQCKNEANEIERTLVGKDKKSEEYISLKRKAEQLDIVQFTLKILLNSIYGVFANKHGPLYDIDCAGSITLTGQAVIKEASSILDEYAATKYNVSTSITHYNDTDSCHISIKPIIDATNRKLLTPDNKIHEDAYKIAIEFNGLLNKKIIEWASKELYSTDPRFFFKREAICSAGLYQAKKHYILHVKDKGEDKPLPCDKIKPVGVELVKSTVSDSIKDMIRRVILTLLNTRDRSKTVEVYREVYEQFKKLPPEEIAFRGGIKTFNKYASQSNGFTKVKGTPVAVSSSINYNRLLDIYNVKDKYDAISGDGRIKWVYCLSTNPYDIKSLAFYDKIPPEFSCIVPDYETMFEKIVKPAIERLFECAKWEMVDLQMEYSTNLLDLFSS